MGFATSGPIARSVHDAAMFLDVIADPVVGDPYWAPVPTEPFSAAVARRPKKLRLATILESAESKVDPEVKAATESALKVFEGIGHSVEVPSIRWCHPVWRASAGPGATSFDRGSPPELAEVQWLSDAGQELPRLPLISR